MRWRLSFVPPLEKNELLRTRLDLDKEVLEALDCLFIMEHPHPITADRNYSFLFFQCRRNRKWNLDHIFVSEEDQQWKLCHVASGIGDDESKYQIFDADAGSDINHTIHSFQGHICGSL